MFRLTFHPASTTPLLYFFFFTLFTGPRSSMSLKLGDESVQEPDIQARLGTTAHLCKAVDLESLKS